MSRTRFAIDISNAFKRVPLRPDFGAISFHQFGAESSQAGEDITSAWLALPYGFSASPAIFALRDVAIQRTRHIVESENGAWSGWEHFHSGIVADDAIFVEADIGNILQEAVEGREWCFRSLFGPDSINIGKIELEGKWPTQGLVLGFDVNSVAGAISAPPPKIEGARIFVLSEEFVVGSQHIALTALQTLRDYMQHWLVASMFWDSGAQPVDLLMAFGIEDGNVINFPNCQIRSEFLDMLSLLQSLAAETTSWPTLFQNKLTGAVALHRRFPGPRVTEEVRRITTGSTPSIIGVVDWYTRTYIRAPAVETMAAFMGEDGKLSGIAGKELMGLVIGSVG